MKIAALDFETSNMLAGSICSVGIVTFANGEEESSYSSLIKPHPYIYAGPWIFEYIHGIRRHDVADSPELPDVLEEMSARLVSADVVVCHNAGFDINQLRAALRIYRTDIPDFLYACTYQICKKTHPGLPNHKLNTIAAHFNHSFRHHDALDDARAAGYIMTRVLDGSSLEDLVLKHRIKVHQFHRS